MSAVLNQTDVPGTPRLERMQAADLDAVVAVEAAIYSHPWTRGNFADSLRAQYDCWVWRIEGELVGYCILFAAAGEAHLLNLSIAAPYQRRGYGSALLGRVITLVREAGERSLFLEVRPSNEGAQRLYQRFGFRRVALRRDYYPAHPGREDALIYVLHFES
jgi:ribosomal-protein-alanine N-acetyltransferase